MQALVSVHDVMPASFDQVVAILPRIRAALGEECQGNLVLLVVPGQDWQAYQLDQLRDWQQQGWILAAHGWRHQAREVRRCYHRLHSLMISRRAAEHLALSEAEIEWLMQKSHDWFSLQGLEAPDLYVPPAWALGRISGRRLASMPFPILK